jgi:hypothetical protein
MHRHCEEAELHLVISGNSLPLHRRRLADPPSRRSTDSFASDAFPVGLGNAVPIGK